MGVLSEIGEFVRSIVDIAKTVPPDKLAILVVGLLGAGGYAGYLIGKSRRKRDEPVVPTKVTTAPPSPELENLARLQHALEGSGEELWRFHKDSPPIASLDKIHASPMKVVTLANLKGGVGKTTVTANLGAYFAEQGKRVLLIDFDYQGSLSATVNLACGRLEASSESDRILSRTLSAQEAMNSRYLMQPRLPSVALLTAGNELYWQENRMLMRWLLRVDDKDPRFALATLLADEHINSKINVVLIDTPPRLTLATINALVASTHFIVPSQLDHLATQNVGNLLARTDQWFRRDLNPRLEFAGVVGTMIPPHGLGDTERTARKSVGDAARKAWNENADVFEQHVPNTARFREDAGRDIAYLDKTADNRRTRAVIEALGQEVSKRIKL